MLPEENALTYLALISVRKREVGTYKVHSIRLFIYAFGQNKLRVGACIIKLITAAIYGFCNKLECLSLANLFSLL